VTEDEEMRDQAVGREEEGHEEEEEEEESDDSDAELDVSKLETQEHVQVEMWRACQVYRLANRLQIPSPRKVRREAMGKTFIPRPCRPSTLTASRPQPSFRQTTGETADPDSYKPSYSWILNPQPYKPSYSGILNPRP
jgi:hypothetical protein